MRLFVALNPDPAERERMVRATAPLREAGLPVRWVAPDALHLTLKFLGEVPDGRVEEVRRAVEAAAAEVGPFELEIGGVGGFPNLRRARVVWIGVEARPELLGLQRAVEDRTAPLGYPTEGRPYSPHLTLGRTARDAPPGALERLPALAATVEYRGVLEARTLDLMRSHLGPRGARYERLLAAPLGSGGV